jgi:Astacin (Peptidase family M12A)
VEDDYQLDSLEADDDYQPPGDGNAGSRPVIVGDMVLLSSQYDYLYSNDSSKRHGLRQSFHHWPNGVLFYKFSNDIGATTKNTVKAAMDYIMKVSCIRFEAAGNVHHVLVRSGTGCSSNVGNTRNGVQHLSLSPHCQLGNIIHELLHSLGFLHMHTAVERDEFVKIDYSNIMPATMRNFEKYTQHVSMFKTPYDYGSIMHYGKGSFAIDKQKPTIIALEKSKSSLMGQRKGKRMAKV